MKNVREYSVHFQESRLSEEMRNDPDQIEILVFRSFSQKLARLQNQLDKHYKHEEFLQDQLTISVDNSKI